MKFMLVALTLVAAPTFAARTTLNPEAPLEITCQEPDGSQTKMRVMSLVYDGSRLVGMNFGPNRGDEGFVVLKGECEVRLSATFALKETH